MLPCGHPVFDDDDRPGCDTCVELDHCESINKSIKLKYKPRGFQDPPKAWLKVKKQKKIKK